MSEGIWGGNDALGKGATGELELYGAGMMLPERMQLVELELYGAGMMLPERMHPGSWTAEAFFDESAPMEFCPKRQNSSKSALIGSRLDYIHYICSGCLHSNFRKIRLMGASRDKKPHMIQLASNTGRIEANTSNSCSSHGGKSIKNSLYGPTWGKLLKNSQYGPS